VLKNSFQSMSTVSLLRALAASRSISGNVSFGIPLVYSLHPGVVDGSSFKRIRVLSLSPSLISMLVRLIHICIICRRQVSSCKMKSHKLLVLCAILNSALTTQAVKEGATIEPLGGVVDPEVQGDTTCRRFLEFYSAQGNKILPSSTPVPDDPYPSPHICWHTSIHAHVS
jgi:hypothetical protein